MYDHPMHSAVNDHLLPRRLAHNQRLTPAGCIPSRNMPVCESGCESKVVAFRKMSVQNHSYSCAALFPNKKENPADHSS